MKSIAFMTHTTIVITLPMCAKFDNRLIILITRRANLYFKTSSKIIYFLLIKIFFSSLKRK